MLKCLKSLAESSIISLKGTSEGTMKASNPDSLSAKLVVCFADKTALMLSKSLIWNMYADQECLLYFDSPGSIIFQVSDALKF